MKIFIKNSWFTFVEILLSTAISIVILIFTFSFLADTMDSISKLDQKGRVLSDIYNISAAVNSYKNVYLTWWIIVDNQYGSWSDIFLLNDLASEWGVIFWVIDKDTMKFESGSVYENYNYKMFWYKELSKDQLNLITADINYVYNLSFVQDHFYNFPVKSFQIENYNSWAILEMNLEVLTNYNSSFSWQLWNSLPTSAYDLFELNLNF